MCETGAVVDPIAVRTVVPGPWGPFHIAATERGIVALEWLTSEPAFDTALARRLGGPVAAATDVGAR